MPSHNDDGPVFDYPFSVTTTRVAAQPRDERTGARYTPYRVAPTTSMDLEHNIIASFLFFPMCNLSQKYIVIFGAVIKPVLYRYAETEKMPRASRAQNSIASFLP
jgi:hypothetical protein